MDFYICFKCACSSIRIREFLSSKNGLEVLKSLKPSSVKDASFEQSMNALDKTGDAKQ